MNNVENTCVACGASIPEGRQVCPHCETKTMGAHMSMTNFERIKAMSVENLADFICDIYASNEHREIRVDGKWMHPEDVEEWLEKEVADDE